MSKLDFAIRAVEVLSVRELLQNGTNCAFDAKLDRFYKNECPTSTLLYWLQSPPRELTALGSYFGSPHFFGDLGHRACNREAAENAEYAICCLFKMATARARVALDDDAVGIATFLTTFWECPDTTGSPLLLRAAAFASIAPFEVIAGDGNIAFAPVSPLFDALFDTGDGVFTGSVSCSVPPVTRLRDAQGRNLLHILQGGGSAHYMLLQLLAERQGTIFRSLLLQADASGFTPLQAAIARGAPDTMFTLLHVLLHTDTQLYSDSVRADSPASISDKTHEILDAVAALSAQPKRYYEWWILSHSLLHTALRAGDMLTFCRLFVLVDCAAAVRVGGVSGGATLLDALVEAPRAADARIASSRVAVASFILSCPTFAPASAYTFEDNNSVVLKARQRGAHTLADIISRVFGARSWALDNVERGFLEKCLEATAAKSLDMAAIRALPFRGALARALQGSTSHGWSAVDDLAEHTVGAGTGSVWHALGRQWAEALRNRYYGAPTRTAFINRIANDPARAEFVKLLTIALHSAFDAVKAKAAALPAPLVVSPDKGLDKQGMFVAYFVECFFLQAYGVMRAIKSGSYVLTGSQAGIASASASAACTSALALGSYGVASAAFAIFSIVGRELHDMYTRGDQVAKATHFCSLFDAMATQDVLRIVTSGAESIALAFRDFINRVHIAQVADFAAVCVHAVADFMAMSGSYEADASCVSDVASAHRYAHRGRGVDAGRPLGRWVTYLVSEIKRMTTNAILGMDVATPSIVRRLSSDAFVAPLRRSNIRKLPITTKFRMEEPSEAPIDVYVMLQHAATLDVASGLLYASEHIKEQNVLSFCIVLGDEQQAKWKGQVHTLQLTIGSRAYRVVRALLADATPDGASSAKIDDGHSGTCTTGHVGSGLLAPLTGSSVPPLFAGALHRRTALTPNETQSLPCNSYLAACAAASAADAAMQCKRPFRFSDVSLPPSTSARLRWFVDTFVATFFETHYYIAKALSDGAIERATSAAEHLALDVAIAAPAVASGASTVGATPQQTQSATAGTSIMAGAIAVAMYFVKYVQSRRDHLRIQHFRQLFADFDFREVVILIQAFAEHIAVKYADPISRITLGRADYSINAVAQVAAMRIFEHILQNDHRDPTSVEPLHSYLVRQLCNRTLGQSIPPVAPQMQPLFDVLEAGLLADGGLQGDEPAVGLGGRTLQYYVNGTMLVAPPAAVFLQSGLRTLGPQPCYFARRSKSTTAVLGHRLGTSEEAKKLGMIEVDLGAPTAAALALPSFAVIQAAPPRDSATTLLKAEAARFGDVIGGRARVAIGLPSWKQHACWLDYDTGLIARQMYANTVPVSRGVSTVSLDVGMRAGAIPTARSVCVLSLDDSGHFINLEAWIDAVGTDRAASMRWRVEGSADGRSLSTVQLWVLLLKPAYDVAQGVLAASGAVSPKRDELRHELAGALLSLADYTRQAVLQIAPASADMGPPVVDCLRLAVELACCECSIHADACERFACLWSEDVNGDRLRIRITSSKVVETPVALLREAHRILRKDSALALQCGRVAAKIAELLEPSNLVERLPLLEEAVSLNPNLSEAWASLADETSDEMKRLEYLHSAVIANPLNAAAYLKLLKSGPAPDLGQRHLAELFERRVKAQDIADIVDQLVQLAQSSFCKDVHGTPPMRMPLAYATILPVLSDSLRHLATALLRCIASVEEGSLDDKYAEEVIRLLGAHCVPPKPSFVLLASSLHSKDVPLALSHVGRGHADALIRLNSGALFARALHSLLLRSAIGSVTLALPPDVPSPFLEDSADGTAASFVPGLALTNACLLSSLAVPRGGHRRVLRVPLLEAGATLWLKEWPDFPGLEAAARLFARRLFADTLPGFGTLWGMPPSAVIVVDGKPFSVSLEASGSSLQSMLPFSDDIVLGDDRAGAGGASAPVSTLPRLDPRTTAAIQIITLLLCSIDGRPDNIVVRPPVSVDDVGHLMCFDNDLCIIPNTAGGIRLGSALLCLGGLLDRIPSELCEVLLAVDVDDTVQKWMEDLVAYDAQLKAALPPSDATYKAAREADSYPYVPMPFAMVRAVHLRLTSLQLLLRDARNSMTPVERHSTTPLDALSCLYPGLAPLFHDAAEDARRLGATLHQRILKTHPHWAQDCGFLWWRSKTVSQTTSARANGALAVMLLEALGCIPTCLKDTLDALSPERALQAMNAAAAPGVSPSAPQAVLQSILGIPNPNLRVARFAKILADNSVGRFGWGARQWIDELLKALSGRQLDGVYRLTIDAAGSLTDSQFAKVCRELGGASSLIVRLRMSNMGNDFT